MRRASRYQRLLAREQGAASVYRALAQRRSGEEREILLALARAEERHAAHWAAKLHPSDRRRHRPGVRTRVLGWLARRLGSLVVLGLVQRAEAAGDYEGDPDATEAMAADEQTHALVVAGLAQRARARSSGWFRAAVFGANDGLVSNFSLVLGMAGAGSSPQVVLLAGLADQEAEELGLVFRARGWRPTRPSGAPRRCVPEATTNRRAGAASPSPTRPAPTWSGRGGGGRVQLRVVRRGGRHPDPAVPRDHGDRGHPGHRHRRRGGAVRNRGDGRVLTGGSLLRRGLRQLGIGVAAAVVTYGLGRLFGTTIG